MKQFLRRSPARWTGQAVLLALLLLPWQLLSADDQGLEQKLQAEYAGKILSLRHFYTGDHLKFHADGTLQGDAAVGPWTLDGQIAVQEIHLLGDKLIIQGRRVCRIFDSQLKPQDQLATIDDYYGELREHIEKTLRSLKAEIEIELAREKPDPAEVSSALHAVFLADSESMMEIVPSFWRDYFARQEGKPQDAPRPAGPLYFAKPGVISPPKATFDPEPEYSPEARKLKYEGRVRIRMVADSSGTTRDLQIIKPLGLGLDEQAIAAITNWKFNPAQKDGKPVAVVLEVEVKFHLY